MFPFPFKLVSEPILKRLRDSSIDDSEWDSTGQLLAISQIPFGWVADFCSALYALIVWESTSKSKNR